MLLNIIPLYAEYFTLPIILPFVLYGFELILGHNNSEHSPKKIEEKLFESGIELYLISILITITIWLRICHYEGFETIHDYSKFFGSIFGVQLSLIIGLIYYKKTYLPKRSEFDFLTLSIALISLTFPIFEVIVLDNYYLSRENIPTGSKSTIPIEYSKILSYGLVGGVALYLFLGLKTLKHIYSKFVFLDFVGKTVPELAKHNYQNKVKNRILSTIAISRFLCNYEQDKNHLDELLANYLSSRVDYVLKSALCVRIINYKTAEKSDTKMEFFQPLIESLIFLKRNDENRYRKRVDGINDEYIKNKVIVEIAEKTGSII